MLACVCMGARVSTPRLRALRAAVDVGVVGLQAFYQASAFNVNIGGWNTASVTSLDSVCAASARRAHRGGRRSVGVRCGAAECAAAPPTMSRARGYVCVSAHASVLVCDDIRGYMYSYM